MSVHVYMIKLMDDKIWLDGKRKIASGTSCLLIGAIRNLKNYSNKQPGFIFAVKSRVVLRSVLEVCCFCTLSFPVFDSFGQMKNDVTTLHQAKTSQHRGIRSFFLFHAFLSFLLSKSCARNIILFYMILLSYIMHRT